MLTIESFEHHGLTIKIHPDDDAEMPDSETVSIVYRKDSRYRLGNKPLTSAEREALAERVRKAEVYILPVYAYVHSGSTIRTTPFDCPWDSGQSGWAYVERGGFKDEAQAHECIIAFVKEFDSWLQGGACGFRIFDGEDEIDSCWGFYDLEYCKSEAKGIAEHIAGKRKAEAQEIAEAVEVD